MKQAAVRRSAKEKSEAELLVTQLNQVELVFERKVGENDHLFGSVTSAEIAQQLEQKGFTIDRRKLQLEEPLRQLGEFHVPVKLHREVTAHVKVTVKAEDAEASHTASLSLVRTNRVSQRPKPSRMASWSGSPARMMRIWASRKS